MPDPLAIPPTPAGAVVPTIGTAPGADDLLAKVASLEKTLAAKREKIGGLKMDLEAAKAKASDQVPTLQATLATKQNKIDTLKAKLQTAQTEASSKKTEAILAGKVAGEATGSAEQSRSFGFVAVIALAAVAGWWAWRKGWLKL
jgi:outer membrane murein-binding lipoprotein Lpp